LYNKEGVTQGDPLSMFMYAVGTLPLIRSLHNLGHWTQLWYADDASAGGTLLELRDWFNLLRLCGPAFGYYPEPTKSFIVVNECWRNDTDALFGDLGVQVVTGHRFLGGFIGSQWEREEYVESKCAGGWDMLMCWLRLLPLSLNLFMLSLQNLCNMNGIFCCVLFPSVALFFRILRCHYSLAFCQPCLVWRCLQLNAICLRFLYDWVAWGSVTLCPWPFICMIPLFTVLIT